MKQIQMALLLAVACCSATAGIAQTSDTTVFFNKENRNAVMLPVQYPQKEAREALRMRLERSGMKEKMNNNVTMYKDVLLPELSAEKIDIYTKVEEGTGNTSIVYMSVSKRDKIGSSVKNDSIITARVRTFLDSFNSDINRNSGNKEIGIQTDDINIDEKYYTQLLDEQNVLLKQRSAIDDKLLEIRNNLLLKRELIEKKKLALQNAKTKQSKL